MGIAALAAVAASVGPFGSTTGTLVVHCQAQLLATGNLWEGDHLTTWQPVKGLVSHVSATAPGSVQFDNLLPGLYSVTTGYCCPDPCGGNAYVAAGKTTTLEGLDHGDTGDPVSRDYVSARVSCVPAPSR
jgi:hypothetical protein